MDIQVVGIVVGSIISGVIGITIVLFTKYIEKKETRKRILKSLLSEVVVNQSQLENAAKYYTNDGFIVPENMPKENCFERTIYSGDSSALGSLDLDNIGDIIRYYSGLHQMDFILRSISDWDSKSKSQSDKSLVGLFGEIKKSKIEEYFKTANEYFEIGEKLRKELERELRLNND